MDMDVLLSINTDSHAVEQLKYTKYGVSTARRGWCTKQAVINTMSYNEVTNFFKIGR